MERSLKLGILLAGLVACEWICAAEPAPLRWGEFGFHSKWRTYGTSDKYPYIDQLPTFDRFPELLELANDPAWTETDKRILLGQLATLSRCDFVVSGHRFADLSKEYQPAIERWKKWWDVIGKPMLANLKSKGRTYPKAWRFVAWSPDLACPDYPLVLPENWSFRLEFMSGDYGGVVKEIIMMRVWKDGAGLERYYRVGWPQAQWTAEVWQGFDRDEAQFFMAAMIYAIDNPWILLRQKMTASNHDAPPEDPKNPVHRIGHIEKRPETWTDYYPFVKWSGVRDDQGHVIMNDDPNQWVASMSEGVGETSLLLGVVYPLLLERYPDPSWDEEASRWKKREITPQELKELEGESPKK